MKRILSALLAVMMCIGMMATASFAAEVTFTDIKSGDWFYEDVKSAVEMGLVNGKSPTRFAPNDKLIYSETIKLAACMHQRYTKGSVTLTNGNPWYMPYVEYCKTNGIISKDYNPTEMVTRAGYIEIFAKALPDEGFKVINNIPDNAIPDVPMSKSYAPAVYKLYRAGILAGVNEAHYCNPDANITRAEVATILVRMMKESARMAFGMGTGSDGSGNEGGSGGGGNAGGGSEATPLSVKTQPVGMAVKLGETAKTVVAVSGGKTPYTYQWQIESSGSWSEISDNPFFSGAKGQALNVALTEATVEKFRCTVTDAAGKNVISDVITLTVTDIVVPLKIKTQPTAQTGNVGETMSFNVEAEGGKAPYSYTWYTSVVTNTGASGYAVAVNSASTTGAGTKTISFTINKAYKTEIYCEIKDADGAVVHTNPIIAEWKETEPLSIATEPADAEKTLSEFATLSVVPSGGKAPYSYSWEWNNGGSWVELTNGPKAAGVKASELKIYPNEIGKIELRCVVTDADGNKVTSRTAILTGTPNPPRIATQPQNVAATVGKPAKISVVAADGTAPYTYQWEINSGRSWMKLADNAQISGAKTATLFLKATQAGTSKLRCVVKDAAGKTVTSNVVSVVFK